MTKSKKKIYGYITASIAVILAIVFLFTNYGPVFGEVQEYGSTYISEVQVFEGDSLNEAVQSCEKAGYTPVKQNINHSNEGDLK